MNSYGIKLTVTLAVTAVVALAAAPETNVTGKVIAAVRNNAIKIPVNHFVPPGSGGIRRIKVEYSVGESVVTNFFAQSAMLNISAPQGKRLIILQATIGD